jgi:rod shape-determining protein MreC
LQTIAQGSGKANELRLPFLANNSDIQIGDLLVTSGLGGRYPSGYPVAEVTSVVHQPGDEFLDVVASPTAHLNRGREVLLVWTDNTIEPVAEAQAEGAAEVEGDARGDTPAP